MNRVFAAPEFNAVEDECIAQCGKKVDRKNDAAEENDFLSPLVIGNGGLLLMQVFCQLKRAGATGQQDTGNKQRGNELLHANLHEGVG